MRRVNPSRSPSAAFIVYALSGIGVGLLINFYVLHLRDGIKRMVDGKDWEK